MTGQHQFMSDDMKNEFNRYGHFNSMVVQE